MKGRGGSAVWLSFAWWTLLFLPMSVLANDAAGTSDLTDGEQAADHQALSRRSIIYPEATEAGAEPPRVFLAADGAPLALHFPEDRLDPRAEVHFVSCSDKLFIRVAERTAFIQAHPVAQPDEDLHVTVTLASGRPLPFTVKVREFGRRDASIEVITSRKSDCMDACVVELTRVRDELFECKESSGERALALIGNLLVEARSIEKAVERRSLRHRDKQNRIFVEVLDSIRFLNHTFIRLRVENRDGSRRTWVAGEPAVAVVGPGSAREPLQVVPVFEKRSIETGEAGLLVLGFETPQLSSGASLRLALHEADGNRHIAMDGLRP